MMYVLPSGVINDIYIYTYIYIYIRERTIIGSVSYWNWYWVYRILYPGIPDITCISC